MFAETLWLVVELIALFFGVTFLVQLFQRRMGSDRVRVWMGGKPLTAALKGIAIGFMTPFCTFTAVPMLLGLRQAGVPPAGYVAFIVAAPVLDPVLFGALVLIVGWNAAVLYLVVAFVAAVTLALVAEHLGIERHLKPVVADQPVAAGRIDGYRVAVGEQAADSAVPQDSGGFGATAPCGGQDDDPWRGLRREARPAALSAVSLLRTMAPLLGAGIAISLVIEVVVPPDMIERLTGASSSFAIPVAAALGTPLYVSTGVFVPIADSLRSAGVGIGAIVALTIAGAGANLPEFVILSRLASHRIIALFFGYVFAVAVIGGLLAQALVA